MNLKHNSQTTETQTLLSRILAALGVLLLLAVSARFSQHVTAVSVEKHPQTFKKTQPEQEPRVLPPEQHTSLPPRRFLSTTATLSILPLLLIIGADSWELLRTAAPETHTTIIAVCRIALAVLGSFSLIWGTYQVLTARVGATRHRTQTRHIAGPANPHASVDPPGFARPASPEQSPPWNIQRKHRILCLMLIAAGGSAGVHVMALSMPNRLHFTEFLGLVMPVIASGMLLPRFTEHDRIRSPHIQAEWRFLYACTGGPAAAVLFGLVLGALIYHRF